MRELAVERQPGTSATESRNEDRLEQLVAGAGLARLERQKVVGGATPIGRVDHRDTELPVVIETNSLRFHASLSDQRDDEQRYQALVSAGFSVAAIWEDDLWSNTASVLGVVREARAYARRGEPTIVHSASCPWPQDSARIIVSGWQPTTRG